MSSLVTPGNLGPEFDIGNIQAGKIRLKLGAGLAIQPDGTIVASATRFLAGGGVTGDANQVNTVKTLTNTRADAGWALAGNIWTYTGSPDHVEINMNAWWNGDNIARIQPVLELLRNNVVVATGSNTYIRGATGHDSSSITIAYTDLNPGANPNYRIRSQQGSTLGQVVTIDGSSLSLKAVI